MNKIDIVKLIVDDLSKCTSEQMENVAHQFIEKKEKKIFIHRGTNLNGLPVRGCVDSLSGKLKIIGEYSIDKQYFNEASTKIKLDIQHAKNISEDKQAGGYSVEKLYLITNQEATNTEYVFWQNEIKAESFDIELLDGRGLAEQIYDLVIDSPNLIIYFSEYLPKLHETILQSFSYLLPSLTDGYQRDSTVNECIHEFLNKNKVGIITGLSGAGKTQAVLDYVYYVDSEYESVFWVNSDDIVKANGLRNVFVSHLGRHLNLQFFMKDKKNLLILDGFDSDYKDEYINNICSHSPESKIIITTISKPTSDYPILEMPQFSEETLYSILNFEIPESLHDSELEREIVKKVNSHPYTLSLINKCVRNGDFEFSEINEDFIEYEGESAKSIFEKIMRRLNPNLIEDLSLLNFFCQRSLNCDFINSLSSKVRFKNLVNRSLLQEQVKNNTYVIHDIVRMCLPKILPEEYDEEKLYQRILSVLERADKDNKEWFIQAGSYIVPKIKEKYSKDELAPCFEAYLILKQEEYNEYTERLISRYILLEIDTIKEYYEVESFIEAFEKDIWKTPKGETKDKKNRAFEEKLAVLISEIDDPRTLSLCHHHRGKALSSLKDFSKSIEQFNKAKEYFYFPQITLQLARVYLRKSKEEKDDNKDYGFSIQYYDDLKKMIETDEKQVNSTCSLSFIEDLKNIKSYEENFYQNISNVKLAASIIIKNSILNYSQPYKAFIGFARKNYFKNPQIVYECATYLLFPNTDECDIHQILEIAECYKQTAKACDYLGSKDKKYERETINILSLISDEDLKNGEYSSYEKAMYGEAIYLYGTDEQCEEAISILNTVSPVDDKTGVVYYRMAQCLKRIGKYVDAIKTIDIALRHNNKFFVESITKEKKEIEKLISGMV